MRKIAILAALAAVAGGLSLAAASPAGAATPYGGHGSRSACLVRPPDNSYAACVSLTVDGLNSADGRYVSGTGTAAVQADTAGAELIRRIQIDRVRLATLSGGTHRDAGPVNSGTPLRPISATTPTAPWSTICDRYRVELDLSARMTDGTLKYAHFAGPWFDSNKPSCASAVSLAPAGDTRCLIAVPSGGRGACVNLAVAGATSRDGRLAYGRGSAGIDGFVTGDDLIARIQVDRVTLSTRTAVIGVTQAPVNSGTVSPPAAEGQTAPGQGWLAACSTRYQVTMNYSVRWTDGHLTRDWFSGPWFARPGC